MKKYLVILSVLLATYNSTAQLVFQDNLSTYTTDAQLSGQGPWTNNSSLPGGGGFAVAGGTNANVTSNAIGYLNYGFSGKSLELKPNADGCGTGFTEVTSGDLYVGMVLNISNAQANNNSDFFRILSGGNFNTSCRIYLTPGSNGFTVGVAKGGNGNPISFSANSYAYGEDHLVIIKYTQAGAASDDVVSVYINPDYAAGIPSSATMTTSSGLDQAGSIDRLSFRQNWTNGMPSGVAGLVSVARTWESLSFLPLSTTSFSASALLIGTDQAKNGRLLITSATNIENGTLKIYSILGTLIENKRINLLANSNEIAINPIQNSGIYIVEVTTQNNKKITKKIIIK